MKEELFERLLYEEESNTLDFKKEQYRFAKASDDEKSELLKDILGFANAWRRSEAYILIGLEDVRGGRANVVGIDPSEHLDDHSLQQFVNVLTNRPVRFDYQAFGFRDKQVGIIRIEEQTRPLFLKKDYGKLTKGAVYVRRGSCTNPSKPADPDEIASMGSGKATHVDEAFLQIEFADPDREQVLGSSIDWSAEFCHMPDAIKIPTLDERPAPIRLPGGGVFQPPDLSSISLHDRLNARYYHELANYIFFRKLVRKIRLVVTNRSEVPVTDVRLELSIQSGQGFGIFDSSEVPSVPKRRERVFDMAAITNLKFRPAVRHRGEVSIGKNAEQMKMEIDCGGLQPGRKVWTESFYIGIRQSGEIKMTGNLFAANLPQPKEFVLAVNAAIGETRMTVDELVALPEPRDDD